MSEDADGWLADLANPAAADRATAAFALGGVAKRRRARAIHALRRALDDPDEMVAEFAAQSLAMLVDLTSLPAIERRLRMGPPRDRTASAWAVCELGRLADGSARLGAIASLRAFHSRARGWSRNHAALLLKRIHGEG